MSAFEMLWVDPKTGEIVEEFTKGAIEIEVPTLEVPPAEARDLGDWFSRKMAELEGAEAAHKAQVKRQAATLKARRKALEFHLPEVETAARSLLDGTRKSVDFAYGRASFRKSRKVEIVDVVEAMLWADEHCPEAIKTPEPTILKGSLPKGVEIPGVVVTEGESFSVKAAS